MEVGKVLSQGKKQVDSSAPVTSPQPTAQQQTQDIAKLAAVQTSLESLSNASKSSSAVKKQSPMNLAKSKTATSKTKTVTTQINQAASSKYIYNLKKRVAILQNKITSLRKQKTIVPEKDLSPTVAQRKQSSLDKEISSYQNELNTAQAKLKKLNGS